MKKGKRRGYGKEREKGSGGKGKIKHKDMI
jgi:hypothetical protein